MIGAISTSSIYWGFRGDGQFYVDNVATYPGATDPADAPWGSQCWNFFEAHAGKRATCIHWGGSGTTLPTSFDSTADSLTRSRNAFSIYTAAASTQQMNDLAANSNANGALTIVDNWATQVQAAGRPILVRFAWEMNGNWGYPWQTAAGISAATYIAAFRTWHDRVDAITSNVSFCWCPNVEFGSVADPTPWFPGAAYVDWMGMDGYGHSATSNESPDQVFDATYTLFGTLAPGKPIAIWETGCSATITSPTKAAWVTDFLGTWLPAHPNVKLMAWFNEAGNPTDPFIEQGPGSTLGGAAQAAFSAGIASSYFDANIVNSTTFPSGAKVPIPA